MEHSGTDASDLETVCWDCGATATLADGARCDCGEPRWLATGQAGFSWPAAGAAGTDPSAFPTGMWRYADLLPVERPAGVGAAAGGTPLVRTARLDEYAGCRLFVKEEGENPTGSFKDRGSAVGVADADAAGRRWVGTVSHGNMAMSVAAHAAGGTPLVRAGRLDEYAGCRLFVKEEGENPTGSFKDRGSAVGVAHADAAGRRWAGTVSHGNMAMSVAAHAAGHDLDCAVLVPADVPAERLTAIARYEPTLLRVDGDYGRLYEETLAVGPDAGIEFVNSDVPLRVAGQKTAALELLEAFSPGLPDAVVLPTSSGGLASATWKALREVETAGLIDEPPRLYLVQSAACDPIARAFRTGAERVERLSDPGETVAYSIGNPDPPSGNRALAAARATGGAVISVPDEATIDAQRRLASEAGLTVEAASAVPLAGLRRLAEAGEVGPDEDVVVVATGNGFKESWQSEGDPGDAVAGTVPREAVADRLLALPGTG